MFSVFFIERPKFALVISLVLSIMGAIAYLVLPVEQFPEITPPVVNVKATYTGANAETVENSVAAPIESQVNGVDGMIYMSSNSTDTGSYSLDVTFAVGTDVDIASVNVQNRVAQAISQLPSEVTNNGVVTEKASTNMLMVVTLFSPNGTYDDVFLSNFASINTPPIEPSAGWDTPSAAAKRGVRRTSSVLMTNVPSAGPSRRCVPVKTSPSPSPRRPSVARRAARLRPPSGRMTSSSSTSAPAGPESVMWMACSAA